MANASVKKTAAQNEVAIKNLKLGMLIASLLSILLRAIFHRNMLTSTSSVILYGVFFGPTFFISRYLTTMGRPKRDAAGTLISPGEDLNQSGLTEYAFDVIYVTWACQVLTGVFGDRFWWIYSIIPGFALFKLWNTVISPMVFGRGGSPSKPAEDGVEMQNTSKRQEKLKKRQEKGDPRVQSRTVRR